MKQSFHKDVLSGLNQMQRQAASFQDGVMLVLAGPGSGKTHVITKRIQYLIEECSVLPESILVVTFTKAAAQEMKQRSVSSCRQAQHVVFGTFHSVFYHMIKDSIKYRGFRLMTDRQKYQLINRIIAHYPVCQKNDMGDQKELWIEEFCKWMSAKKNQIPLKTELENKKDSAYAELYQIYKRELSAEKWMDYDDILCFCYDMLSNDPSFLMKWRKRFRYILVDEYQDVSPIQAQCVRLLSDEKNVFAVGDDDQSIYQFRGSDVKLMKELLAYKHGAKTVTLGVNYRSDKRIVALSSKFIAQNEGRFEKEYVSNSMDEGTTSIHCFESKLEEMEFIKKEIQKYSEQNETVAILTRTNKEARQWMALLQKRNPGLQREKEALEPILAMLRFIHKGQNRYDFLIFMNKPERYLLREIVDEEVDLNRIVDHLKRQNCEKMIVDGVNELSCQLAFLKELDPYASLTYIMEVMKYKTFLKLQYPEVIHEVERLKEHAKQVKTMDEFIQAMEREVGQNELDKKNQGKEGIHDLDSKKISVMTYHASKGLEFDRVYLPGVNDGMVPHGRYLEKEELEEERRMFYVAMTRAKRALVITYQKKQTSMLSPFIRELLE